MILIVLMIFWEANAADRIRSKSRSKSRRPLAQIS